MNKYTFGTLLSLLLFCLTGKIWAQPVAIPPNIIGGNAIPMVMLSMSRDYSMFSRAYTDYEDIDFDGVIDYTFKPAFKYYGYFDPLKCYQYDATNGYFAPASLASQDKDSSGNATGGYYCANSSASSSNYWSGNFLNWATMSRLDVLRRMLYGGYRYSDPSSPTAATVLELSFLPRNTMAIVKYYNGSDLIRLTPFNYAQGITLCRRHQETSGTTPTTTTPQIRVAKGNYILWNMTEVRSCNWDAEVSYTWSTATITFLSNTYVTPAGATGASNTNFAHGSKTPSKTSAGATYGSPALGPEFTARVKVCDSAYFGSERCKKYSGGNYKPTGLLHEFGESANYGSDPARAEFGLMLGSYDSNLTSGVLRKNMAEINDEINSSTGQFVATPAVNSSNTGGIIKSLNALTLYGYNMSTGNYGDTCYSGDPSNGNKISNGKCPSWGNPMGEILLESLLYYAGKSASVSSGSKDTAVGLPAVAAGWRDPVTYSPAYSTNKTRKDLYGQGICRPMNVLTITSNVNSFDNDEMSSRFATLTSNANLATLTDTIGTTEGINGTSRLVGANSSSATSDFFCTPKAISKLSEVLGVCPDGPNFFGTYLGAGAAYYANTHALRTLSSTPSDLPKTALMVKNFGVSMSGGSATIEIPVPGSKTSKVYLTPSSIDTVNVTKPVSGNMVDFKVLARSADGLSGTFLVLWQHDMLGEDQDQDMLGTIRYTVDSSTSPPTISIYTQTVESDTGSTLAYTFGYTLVGTDADGQHGHSSINSANAIDQTATYDASSLKSTGSSAPAICTGSPRLCVRFGTGASTKWVIGETKMTYKMTGATDATIKEPLWYIAKYGGFTHDGTDPNALPTKYTSWDNQTSDGKRCNNNSATACDGVPDTYYQARRPDLLENALRDMLEKIAQSSNSAPAISSSQIRDDSFKYVARFDSGDGRGELAAYAIDSSTGSFLTSPAWLAHEQLTDFVNDPAKGPGKRVIITNNGVTGVPFRWASFDSTKQGYLAGSNGADYGERMSIWLRGCTGSPKVACASSTSSSISVTEFRTRNANSIMGAIVNSNPTVEATPNADYFGDNFGGYASFVKSFLAKGANGSYTSRTKVIWVGAGDGMLHGFNATTGAPMISYVPEPLFPKLKDWANPNGDKVIAFVDGSPITADVGFGGGMGSDGKAADKTWATYLFSSLGRGGKAMFALDVTNPDNFTEANAASIFKWQFTASDDRDTSGADSKDLGYIVSDGSRSRFNGQSGQVALMNNGKFAVLFGNGVQSVNGSAVLYVLFAEGPTSSGSWSGRFVKLVADPGSSGSTNGLAQPVWVDMDGNGTADVIYAGDLYGHLWKFDVSSSDPSNWGVAYGGTPMFTAYDSDSANKHVLPISGGVDYKFHPNGGVMVIFGTGKALSTADYPDTTRTYGVFGIWDQGIASKLPSKLADLYKLSLNDITFTDSVSKQTAAGRYTTQDNPADANKRGWYVPFTYTSEMSLSNVQVAQGQVLVVSIAKKTVGVGQAEPCFSFPNAFLNVFDPLVGVTSKPVLGQTEITVTGADGTQTKKTVYITTLQIEDQRVRFATDNTSKGSSGPASGCTRVIGQTTDRTLNCTNTRSRIYWREIPGLTTRKPD